MRALSPLLLLALAGCFDIGLGAPGSGAALPAGGLPATQTLEGGAQIYVTPAGLTKLKAAPVSGFATRANQTFCLPSGSLGGDDYCDTSPAPCTNGCAFTVVSGLPPTLVVNEATNKINVTYDVPISAQVHINPAMGASCTASLTVDSFAVDLDIGFGIDPTTGILTAQVTDINSLTAAGVSAPGCSGVTNINALITEVVNQAKTAWLDNNVSPATLAVINADVPSPRELAAMIDLPGALLLGAGSSTGALVETRIMQGGYVSFVNNGLALGVVTGFNSDANPLTRGAGMASESHACVPSMAPPDFAAAGLSPTSRGTFLLPPAGPLLGNPGASDDMRIGISQSALSLAGHHVVAAGGLCLTRADLDADALDDLLGLPLAAVGSTLDLVVRPQQPMSFTVGTGTAGDPALHAHLPGLRLDLEPALSVTADVELSLALGTRHNPSATFLETLRAGLSVTNPVVVVNDSRYAPITASELDVLVATAVDLLFESLGAGSGQFIVPGINSLATNVHVERLTTAADTFLTINASLGGATQPVGTPAPTPIPLAVTLTAPGPTSVRAAILAGDPEDLPTVHITLPTSAGPCVLEHAWRVAGGAWRPYEATGEVVVRDRGFAWQGARHIELRSRCTGDDSTTSSIGSTDVVIDYAPPTIFADQVTIGATLEVPARDAVSPTLEWAVGRVGDSAPTSGWGASATLDLAAALALGNDVIVFVRDEAHNVAQLTVHLADAPPGEDPGEDPDEDGTADEPGSQPDDGCSCRGTATPSSLMLFGIFAACLAYRSLKRRSR